MTFNEITKKAVQEAFKHARDVDQNLVDAQQTRRVLDRLVGYQISPLLWDKVRRGLSAGRVQTVAVRLIVEREREIGAFKPVEYWTLDAMLHPEKQADKSFKARFIGIDGEPARVANGKDKDGKDQFISNALPDKKAMDEVVGGAGKSAVVAGFSAVAGSSSAGRCLRSSPASCSAMRPASWASTCAAPWAWRSGLYEGVELGAEGTVGLITYMRTDSPRVAPEAIDGAREWIGKQLGAKYLPADGECLQGQEGCAGRARSDSSDGCDRGRRSRLRAILSDEQLKLYTADLAALCCLADDAGGF